MLRSRSATALQRRWQREVAISPNPYLSAVKRPAAVLPSQRLASFQNQQLGAINSGVRKPGLGQGPTGLASMASAGRVAPVSVVGQSSMNILDSVKGGNARLAALQKKAQPRQQSQLPGPTGSFNQQGQYKSYSGSFKPGSSRGYGKGQIDVSQTVKIGNAYLRKDAGQAFMQMAQAYKAATGKSLAITEGWRSYDRQVKLYNDYRSGRGNLAAKPGTSDHGRGTSVDMRGMGAIGSPSFNWLRQNAKKFGYDWTGGTFSQIEAWHWSYTG